MLLLHQLGSVRIGEVIRYTVTYTPSQDLILPSPQRLHLRVRNTSAIALRAAFVHGPYTLCVATYPATFNPNERFANPRRYGVPEFEPMVKAGGSWQCELKVPDDTRLSAGAGLAPRGKFGADEAIGSGSGDGRPQSVSWIVEISSQVIFSTSASVGFDLQLARDEQSLAMGYSMAVVGAQSAQSPRPGRLEDHQQSIGAKHGHHAAQPKGVFSRAIKVRVEDTATLWNTPRLPGWDDAGEDRLEGRDGADRPVESAMPEKGPAISEGTGVAEKDAGDAMEKSPNKPKKRVHLVMLTHGLHGNLGADMLFMKESIDAAAKQAKADAKARRAWARERAKRAGSSMNPRFNPVLVSSPASLTPLPLPPQEPSATTPGLRLGGSICPGAARDGLSAGAEAGGNNGGDGNHDHDDDDDEDEEEVIVRGYSGNATKTEKGIKYLGKRLARYILALTYPDQPLLPDDKSKDGTKALSAQRGNTAPACDQDDTDSRAYRITSISFVGHSLGGLIQMYAVAYIQKHSPSFFDLIRPVNFITLASPLLGLSNENPLYVKFALDFGLVGRTGQDLGLTWRAPTLAKSGWGAIVSTLGESTQRKVLGDSPPESKPLLRILPTGPAHTALGKFRNRTVYSNVVNDGIVPLRTSCLLFLDWQGLGRVDKARREAGLVETVVGFGWAELTGTNMGGNRRQKPLPDHDLDHKCDDGQVDTTPTSARVSPLLSGTMTPGSSHQVPQPPSNATAEDDKQSLRALASSRSPAAEAAEFSTPFSGFFSLFRSTEPSKQPPLSEKTRKIFKRSQTLKPDDPLISSQSPKMRATSGHELLEEHAATPPRTSFFESARDLLNPPLPSVEYLIDPSKRPRSIFHDRVYHPSDIPPPPLKKRNTSNSTSLRSKRSTSFRQASASSSSSSSSPWPLQGPHHEDSLSSTKDYDDTANTGPEKEPDDMVDSSNMRVEEKIARAYHRDLSWRKVLVNIEPDAHNNIIVRRMFANAFGWPIVKHLVDNHFSDSATGRTPDDDESGQERARSINNPPDEHGRETNSAGQPSGEKLQKLKANRFGFAATAPTVVPMSPLPHLLPISPMSPLPPQLHLVVSESSVLARTPSEQREAEDTVPELLQSSCGTDDVGGQPDGLEPRQPLPRHDSVVWSDRDWVDSDGDSDVDGDSGHFGQDEPTGGLTPAKSSPTRSALKSPSTAEGPGPLSTGWGWAERIVGKGAMESLKGRTARPGSASGDGSESWPKGRSISRSGSKTRSGSQTRDEPEPRKRSMSLPRVILGRSRSRAKDKDTGDTEKERGKGFEKETDESGTTTSAAAMAGAA